MNNVIISDLYPCFCEALRAFDYNIIPTKNINEFSEPEQKHADMQVLRINNSIFTLDGCVKTAGKSYPENVLLNCLYLNNKLYGKLSALDDSVLEYCRENGIKTVNVNQGYTRCSTLVVNKKAAITADKSIEKALKNDGADVLLIEPGHIELKGFNYGFIGGASFCDNNKVFFFGNIKAHPDYDKIKQFCDKNKLNIEILRKDMPLTDIGGAVVI